MTSTIYNVELNTFDSSKMLHQDLGKFELEAFENKNLEKILIFKSKFNVNQIFFNFKFMYLF